MEKSLLNIASELGQIRGTVMAVKENQELMREENIREHEEVKAMLKDMDSRLGKRIDEIEPDHKLNTWFRKVATWVLAAFFTAWATTAVAAAVNLW